MVRPSLFVVSGETSGPFDIGIRFEIEPAWYLYWINPGDAGLPVDVQWVLPDGWTAGPLRFPTPEKIVKGGITAFGYHKDLVVFCRITPKEGVDGAPPLTVTATLDWLVCRESCLPGSAELRLAIDRGAFEASVISSERLQQYRDRFPLPLEASGVRVRGLQVRPDGASSIVHISLAGEKASDVGDFYPELINGYTTDLTSIQIMPGEILMRITPNSPSSDLGSVRGIVMLGKRGYALEASLHH